MIGSPLYEQWMARVPSIVRYEIDYLQCPGGQHRVAVGGGG